MYKRDFIHCDGGCGKSNCYVLASGPAAARRSARQDGWTTARGRDLCPACTAKHNAVSQLT